MAKGPFSSGLQYFVGGLLSGDARLGTCRALGFYRRVRGPSSRLPRHFWSGQSFLIWLSFWPNRFPGFFLDRSSSTRRQMIGTRYLGKMRFRNLAWKLSSVQEQRPGDPVEALSRLLRHRPRLKQLQKEVLEQLARAEASWTKVRDSRSFDFGCIAVGYGKAAEAFFRRVLSSARETHRYTRWLISRVRTDAGQP